MKRGLDAADINVGGEERVKTEHVHHTQHETGTPMSDVEARRGHKGRNCLV